MSLEHQGHRGRGGGVGVGVGVYYLGETPQSMTAQVEGIRDVLESGATRAKIYKLPPPGGARNAVDCALWNLEYKISGTRIWSPVGVEPTPLATVATVGTGTPAEMAAKAVAFRAYPNLEIEVGSVAPLEKLRAIRVARPEATLVIEVNQGWSMAELEDCLPALAYLDSAMVEQPLLHGGDSDLVGFSSPIPLGGDESCVDLEE